MEIILGLIGGRLYTWLELLCRGRTHWTMFFLGGVCFVIIGLLNEHLFSWKLSLVGQSIMGAVIVTILEFFTGCIVNRWMGWNVWDYSDLPYNVLGQICLYYFLLWIPLSTAGIILDDWMRYWFYLLLRDWRPWMEVRQRPHYRLIGIT